MVESKGIVKTDVDSLVELVKKKKEISFEQASKELSIPFSTVESWGNFLEEEGELSINYKFTTPYLVAIEEEEKISNQILKHINKHSSEIENSFFLFSDNVSKEDYIETHKTILKIYDNIKDLVSIIKKEKELSDKVNIFSLNERLDLFKNIIKHTYSLKNKGETSRLKSAYHQIFLDLKHIYDNLNKVIKEYSIKKQKEEEEEKNKKEIKPIKKNDGKEGIEEEIKEKIQVNIDSFDDYSKYINLVDDALNKGNLDDVKEIYSKMESFYNQLPVKFNENRLNLKNTLLKINEKLSNKITEDSIRIIEQKSKEIYSLSEIIKKNLKEQNLSEAEKNFNKIELLFSELPKGYSEIKIKLENLIVDLHSELINIEKEHFIHEINDDKNKIDSLIKNIDNYLNKSDVYNSKLMYNEIIKIFESIPKGFFQEKIELQKKISKAYERILFKENELKKNSFEDKVGKISLIIDEVENYLKNEDLHNSNLKINELNKIFEKLPSGFYKKKSEIENYILSLSKKLFVLEEKIALKKYNELKNEIEKLISKANSYISKKENDIADEIYKEILDIFNKLPSGFYKEKLELKSKILKIYHKLILDKNLIENKLNTSTYIQKYNLILRLIVQVHEEIEKRNFNSMIEKYNKINKLYKELPIGFIQERSNVRHEILKIYDLVTLYENIIQLEEDINNNQNINDIKKKYSFISKLYKEIFEECKEDIELFSFIKEKYFYLYSLISKKKSEKNFELEQKNNLNQEIIENNKKLEKNNFKENKKDKLHEEIKEEDNFFKEIKYDKLPEEIKKMDKYLKENKIEERKKIIEEKKDKERKKIIEENKINLMNEELFKLAIEDFLNKNYESAILNLNKIKDESSLNNKYSNLKFIINKINNNQFLPELETEAFFSSLSKFYNNQTINSKLCFTKLLRSIYELLNNNFDLAEEDIKRIIKLFPNDSDVLKIKRYIKKRK